ADAVDEVEQGGMLVRNDLDAGMLLLAAPAKQVLEQDQKHAQHRDAEHQVQDADTGKAGVDDDQQKRAEGPHEEAKASRHGAEVDDQEQHNGEKRRRRLGAVLGR